MADHTPRRLGSYFSSDTLFSLGMPRDLKNLPEVCVAWAEVVGEPLVQHVVPMRYSDGCLNLRADSSVWASKVRYQQQLLIERLHTKSLLQNLTMIKIRVAPLQQDRPAPARAPLVYRPSVDTLKLLQQVATDIDDPGLRAALQRLGRQHKP